MTGSDDTSNELTVNREYVKAIMKPSLPFVPLYPTTRQVHIPARDWSSLMAPRVWLEPFSAIL